MSDEEIIKIPSTGDLIQGQFRLEKEIGRGGFGVVYRANQIGMERTVAVKLLLPHAMTHPGVVERFQREARLASSLTHRNSVTIYASGLHQPEPHIRPLPYIAMEYLVGKTLQQHIAIQGKLNVEDAINVLQQSLASLSEAHKKGIIHRDLKPENIFIVMSEDELPTIKVLDFGIAKAVSGDWDPKTQERLTRTGFIAGTAEYMAPEQATGAQDITTALDVYAMGCIAYQLVTGHVPFSGNSPMEIAIKHLSEPIPPLPADLRGSFIERVIQKAVAKEPAERFQDAEEFLAVLQSRQLDYTPRLAATHTLRGRSDSREEAALAAPVQADAPPQRNHTLLLLGGAAAILIILVSVLIVLLLTNKTPEAAAVDPLLAAASAPTSAPTSTTPPASEAQPPPDFEIELTDPSPKLTLDATPVAASVYHGDRLLGQTPLVLDREEIPDDTFTVQLRAEGYDDTPLAIDWNAPPEDGNLLATLKRSPVPSRGARNTVATRRGNAANSSANDKTPKERGVEPPPIFDLGGGKPKADKTPPPSFKP